MMVYNVGKVYNVPQYLLKRNHGLFDNLLGKPTVYFELGSMENEILISALPNVDIVNMYGILMFTRSRVEGTNGILISDITADCQIKKQYISYNIYMIDRMCIGNFDDKKEFYVREASIRDYLCYPSIQTNVESILKVVQGNSFRPLDFGRMEDELPRNNIRSLEDEAIQTFVKKARFINVPRSFDKY